MFREFIHLNTRLVEQFLAQAEGGIYDESTEKTTQSGKGGIGGGVNTPVLSASADKSRSSSFEDERKVRQTPESQFNRLYDYLAREDLLSLEAIDESDFMDSLSRGSILEVHDVELQRSGFQEMGELAKDAKAFLPFADMLGIDTKMDTTDRAQLDFAANLDDESKPMSVIGSIAGTAHVGMAMELRRDNVLQDISGEASVLVKVSKVLKPGETHAVGDIMSGLGDKLPRAERRKMMREASKSGIGTSEIKYPGFVATVVAIYR